jgi:ribosomal protein S18 acetylase RimI-like enzyme
MLFATATLARRIEQAECSLVADMARAVSRRLGADAVVIAPIAGGSAISAGIGSPLNKLAGIGFEPVDDSVLGVIEGEFERRGIPLQVELSSLASPGIAAMLTRRGYTLTGFENVLGLPLGTLAMPPEDSAIAICRTDADEARRWIDVIATGFAHADTFDGPVSNESYGRELLEQIFEDTLGVDGSVRYMARRDGSLAGAASMRLSNGVAQLCGAATLPEHRRRGVQTALLATRLRDAARDGCDIAIVTTQPGSKSQENVQRQGFSLLYTRAILVKSW